MYARFIAIAAILMSSSAIAADSAKPAPQPPAQSETAPAKVMLASAQLPAASPQTTEGQKIQPPPPPRHGRVTGCRCGDQEAQPDDE